MEQPAQRLCVTAAVPGGLRARQGAGRAPPREETGRLTRGNRPAAVGWPRAWKRRQPQGAAGVYRTGRRIAGGPSALSCRPQVRRLTRGANPERYRLQRAQEVHQLLRVSTHRREDSINALTSVRGPAPRGQRGRRASFRLRWATYQGPSKTCGLKTSFPETRSGSAISASLRVVDVTALGRV